ncbi:MAG: hypothetical protein IPG32_14295 [Saprospirales bacterium]|nr:hypothetical protein [Saprospirales bacterium]
MGKKEDYVWVLGGTNDSGSIFSTSIINFNVSPPSIKLNYAFNDFSWTNTNISDPEGNLMCYSNGVHLFNSQGEIIENGDEFQSSSSYSNGYIAIQGGLIIPYSDHPNQLIFYTM